jgi:hypothetical protein
LSDIIPPLVAKAKGNEVEAKPVWKGMLPPKFPGIDRVLGDTVMRGSVAKRIVVGDIERSLLEGICERTA